MVAVDEVGGGGRVPVVGARAMAMTVVLADADLMAAQPEAMLAAAAAFEGAAHRVNSVSDATVRSSQALLAAWEGNGAAGFRTRVSRLTSSMPAAAQALLATAGALRTLAPKIAEAQALARRAGLLFEQVASAGRSTAFPAHALEADAATAALMTERANTMGRQAFAAATAAFDAITGISPSAKSAVLASDVKVAHARRSHVHPRKHGGLDSQVKVVTEANGQRVYSFDGGLKIPVNMRGARRIVSGVEGYMPRFEHTYQAAGLSGRALWFNAVENYCTSVIGAAPQKLRNLFFTDRFSSITMRQAAGTSMFMITGTAVPAEPEVVRDPDFVDNGDGPPPAPVAVSNAVAGEQIKQADEALGTEEGGGTGVDSIRNVNPLRGTKNCLQCAIAGDATLGGSPASALDGKGPQPVHILEREYGGTFKPVSGKAEIEQMLKDAGPGSRGIVQGTRIGMPGHVFNAVNNGGKIEFLDAQSGRVASFGDHYFRFRFLWTNKP